MCPETSAKNVFDWWSEYILYKQEIDVWLRWLALVNDCMNQQLHKRTGFTMTEPVNEGVSEGTGDFAGICIRYTLHLRWLPAVCFHPSKELVMLISQQASWGAWGLLREWVANWICCCAIGDRTGGGWEEDGRRTRRRAGGYRTKTKNPTRQCGEKGWNLGGIFWLEGG